MLPTFIRDMKDYVYLLMMLNQFRFEYYKLSNSSMEDRDYDKLYRVLRNYEYNQENNEDFIPLPWSPTQSLDGEDNGYNPKEINEETPWLSLSASLILSLDQIDLNNVTEQDKNKLNKLVFEMCKCLKGRERLDYLNFEDQRVKTKL